MAAQVFFCIVFGIYLGVTLYCFWVHPKKNFLRKNDLLLIIMLAEIVISILGFGSIFSVAKDDWGLVVLLAFFGFVGCITLAMQINNQRPFIK